MKKLSMFFLSLIVAVTFSCSSDDSSSSTGDTYIKFKVNGVQYSFQNVATATSLIGSLGAYSGSGESFRSITLDMPVEPTVGEHPITAPSFDMNTYESSFAQGEDIDVDATSGTMVITSVNADYVVGTFSWTGTHDGVTYTITDGEFKGYTPEEL